MDTSPISLEELRRQLEAHLHSLRAAGIEWLPRGIPITLALRSADVVTAPPSFPAPETPTTSVPSAAPASEPRPATPMDDDFVGRRQALAVLAQEIKGCTRCPSLASTRRQTVFGQGEPGAELCFVGEAPGADEDREGIPFVGKAGELLTRIIEACGLRRDDVYICNVIKCRPPGNRTPEPGEVANCHDFLKRQLELVRPKFIVALGSSAASRLLQTTETLGRLRGRFHDYQGTPVLVTYHPSYLLPHRNPAKKREVWDDMQMLMAKMGRQIPARG